MDDVVAEVHGVGAYREHLHPECIDVACGHEGFVPPRRAVQERRPDGLGHSAVEVVDDGLDRLRARGGWVLLLETVTDGPLHVQAAVDRARVVGERQGERVPIRGSTFAGRVVRVGKLDEGVVQADAHRFGVGGHGSNERPRLGAGEGEERLDLGVAGKAPRPWHVNDRAGELEGALALFRPIDPPGHPVGVTEKEARGVHEDSAVLLGHDFEAPVERKE